MISARATSFPPPVASALGENWTMVPSARVNLTPSDTVTSPETLTNPAQFSSFNSLPEAPGKVTLKEFDISDRFPNWFFALIENQ